MTKRLPITKRFPGSWCFRGKIWSPERYAFEYVGGLPIEVGSLLILLLTVAFSPKLLTPKVKTVLANATKALGKQISESQSSEAKTS